MKKMLFAVVTCALAGLSAAQEPLVVKDQADVGVTADLGIYSHYVWRGQIYDDSVAQPSLTVTKGPISLNIWGNYNLESRDDQSSRPNSDLTETDFTLSCQLPDTTDDFDIEVGIIKYTYTDAADLSGTTVDSDTEELYGSMIFYHIILTPTISLYHDLDANEGWYGSLALAQPIEISEALKLEAGASVGMADGGYNSSSYPGSSGGGANDYNISMKASYQVTDDIAVGALIQYTVLDGNIKDEAKTENGADNAVWGGINLSYTF